VLVKEDQLSLAIGRRGQNVRLASKLVGWDIEIMTHDELNEGIERAEGWFLQIPGVTPEMVEAFIEEGFLSYADLTFMEPAQLAEIAGVTEDQAEEMIACAEEAAEAVEEQERQQKALEASQPPQPVQTAAQKAAAKLFSDTLPPPVTEAKQTFESLFKPDVPAAAAGAEAAPAPAEEGVAVSAETPPAGEAGAAPAHEEPAPEMASAEAAPAGEPAAPQGGE
jgi:N utilization substance protein A